MDNEAIGMNIKKYRKGKFTQQELAEKIGKTESSIRKYEKGLVTTPLNVLNEIATALEVKVSDLMGISDYLDEVESSLQETTSFWDYLSVLGYEIGQGEHEDYQMHIKENDTYIELSSEDVQLLKELEDSTSKDIKRTIELLIATKIRP